MREPVLLAVARGDETSVPEVVAPPPGHPRFPLFDSLRAMAALGVVVVHTATLSGALSGSLTGSLVAHLDIGVTLFFVISGFLLYRPFVATRVLGAPASRIGDYARRRFLRIAPAYWLALTVLAIFPGIYGVFSGNWWVYYGLLANYPIYAASESCVAEPLRCGIDPVWTLGIEVGFYAVLPVFAFGMIRLTRMLRGVGWFSVELAVLGLIALISIPITVRFGSGLEHWFFFSPLGHGLWFATGMALAALSVHIQERGAEPAVVRLVADRPLIPWAIAATLYVLCSLVILDPLPGELLPGAAIRFVLFGVIAALLLVPAVFGEGRGGFPRRLLSLPPFAWLGLVSYGVFLWHWPIVMWLMRSGVGDWWPAMAFPVVTAVTLAITLACASVSYYLVERPLMKLKYRGSRGGRTTTLPSNRSRPISADPRS